MKITMCCEEDWQKKKIFWGVLILLFGVIWYLNSTGQIKLEPFWPIVVMVFGLILICKAFIFPPMKKAGKR
jgi:hypothetical protein